MVKHDVQKILLHLAHAILKLMVDLDQLVIVIMAVANHQGLGIKVYYEKHYYSTFFYSISNSFSKKLAFSFYTPITL